MRRRSRSDDDDGSSQLTYSDGEEEDLAVGAVIGRNNSSSNSHDNQEDSYRSHYTGVPAAAAAARDDEHSDDTDDNDDQETIALFGASGPTGHHFMRLALDAGYKVRALVTPGTANKMMDTFEDLHAVSGTLEEADKIQQVVYSATYVVCMVGETLTQKKGNNNSKQQPPQEYPKDCLTNFVKRLYPIMTRQDDPVIQGFLFQSTALAADPIRNKTPLFSKLVRSTVQRGKTAYLQDTDAALQFIHSQHKKTASLKEEDPKWRPPLFPYIVTRPGVLREGPSTKKLAASKSQPGPFPCCYVDLAEFSLNALKMKKLYNSCPYVVGDGFY